MQVHSHFLVPLHEIGVSLQILSCNKDDHVIGDFYDVLHLFFFIRCNESYGVLFFYKK